MITTKLLTLCLCATQTPFANSIEIDVAPEPVAEVTAYSSDGESSLYGFNVDTDAFDVTWKTNDINVSYNSVYCGTLRVNVGGVKMKQKLDNGRFAYGVLIRSTMSPKVFTLTADGKSQDYRGRSKNIYILSSLAKSQSLIDVQPNNVAGLSSYSIGVSIGGDSSGFNGSISASTEITKDALEISNTSDIVNGDVALEYKYNRHVWPWEWERTKYCWFDSVQRSSFFFSSETPLSSKTIVFKPTFAIDDAKLWVWNLEMGYEITATSVVSAYFPN